MAGARVGEGPGDDDERVLGHPVPHRVRPLEVPVERTEANSAVWQDRLHIRVLYPALVDAVKPVEPDLQKRGH